MYLKVNSFLVIHPKHFILSYSHYQLQTWGHKEHLTYGWITGIAQNLPRSEIDTGFTVNWQIQLLHTDKTGTKPRPGWASDASQNSHVAAMVSEAALLAFRFSVHRFIFPFILLLIF